MEIVKVCSACKIALGLYAFSKDKSTKDGLQFKCKGCYKVRYEANRQCYTEVRAAYTEANKDKIAEYQKIYRELNKDKRIEGRKAYYQANKDKIAEYQKCYDKANPAKANAKTAKRRSSKLKATPSWLTKEDYNQIQAFYDQAQQLTLSTGVQHQVDHIYPLQGETVCGLHVPSNLQVLTAAENMGKSNKFTVSD
jgi:hypothetical protein